MDFITTYYIKSYITAIILRIRKSIQLISEIGKDHNQ